MVTRSLRIQAALFAVLVISGTGIAQFGPIPSETGDIQATVSGDLETADRQPVRDGYVLAVAFSGGSIPARVGDDGTFSLELVRSAAYVFGFSQYGPTTVRPSRPVSNTSDDPVNRDGVPDIYSFRYRADASTTDVGTIRLPDAHPVTIRVADPDRSFPTNASFGVFHAPNLTGRGYHPDDLVVMRLGGVRINESGYAVFDATGEAEIELAGRVRVGVYTPGEVGVDWLVGPRTVHVTGERRTIVVGGNRTASHP
jgi:hypothetical protein